jgi:hypothetical protein
MINEDEARALWRRAAELQAVAEDREAGQYSLAPAAEDESAFTVDVGIMTGAALYRRIYRWATRKGEAALERVLEAIAFEASGTGSLSMPRDED